VSGLLSYAYIVKVLTFTVRASWMQDGI